MNKLTVYFHPPEEFIDQLSDISDNFPVSICTHRDELESCLPDTEILVTLFAFPDAELIGLASKLRWIILLICSMVENFLLTSLSQ